MAENRNLHVNLSVKADTSEAKAQFQDLQNTLSNLGKMKNISLGGNITKDMLEASSAALSLKQNLQDATNVNTGKLDLSLFKKSLEQSGQSLTSYRQQLTKLGPEGEQAFMKVASAISSAELPLKRTNTMLAEFAGTLKNTARWQISSSILHGFMGSLQTAYNYAQNLNRSLNDIQIVTQHSSDYMAQFAEKANKAAKELSATTTAYTNASLIFYQQGLSDEEVEKRTEVTLKMANASRQSAEEVSSQLTAVWNNFYDGSKSLEYYADVLTALGAATASSSSEISAGLQKFASIGETVGLSYEYAASALATITATSRESAETVGNALKTLFARMQSLKLGDTLEDGVDLNKYAAALEKVGVHVLDANNELRDMDDILDDLMERWENLDRTTQTALAQTVAGQRQYAQFMTLMNQSDFFKANVGVAEGSEGTLQKQADTYAESWEAAQKRVQAAAQAIYQDLLDDKFFITLLNGLEKVLTGIDGFIDSIGGLKGVLATFGTVALTVFKDQISSGIETAIHNFSMLSDAGKEAYQTMQKNAIDEIFNMSNGSDSVYLQNMTDGYQRIGELHKVLVEEAEQMTVKEREHAQQLIKRQETYEELVKRSGEELDNIRAAAEARAKNAIIESRSNGSGISTFDYSSEYNKLATSAETYRQAMDAVNTAQSQFNGTTPLTREQVEALQKALSESGTTWTLTDQDINDLTSSADSCQVVLELLTNCIQDELIEAEEGFHEATQVSLETTNDLVVSLNEESAAEERDAQATENAKNAHEQAANSMRNHTQSMEDYSRSFVTAMGGITSVVGGLNSLSRAYETVTDKEKSVGEKILPTITSISMGLPMLINGISKLSTSWKGAVSFITGTFGTIVSVAKTALAAIGPAGWVILGITAAVGVAATAYNLLHKEEETALEKLQKEHEKMSKAAQDAASDADKLKSKYESLNSSISKYEEAVTALEECTTGTQEWYKALDEVYGALNDILTKQPELAQFVTSAGEIDLDAAKAYMEQMQNNQIMTMFASNIGSAVANQESAEIDKESIGTEIAEALQEGFKLVEENKDAANYVTVGNFNYGNAEDNVLSAGYIPAGVLDNIHLDSNTIDEISKAITENPEITVDDVRELLENSIAPYFGDATEFQKTIINKDENGDYQTSYSSITKDALIDQIIEQNFSPILSKFSQKVEQAEDAVDTAKDAVKGMAQSAVNWKIAQEKGLGVLDDFEGVSEDVVAAFLSNKIPDKIDALATKLEEGNLDDLWEQYQKAQGTNYSLTSSDDGKFTYDDGSGKEQEIDISSVAYEIATIQTLTTDWGLTLEETEAELKNLVDKAGGPFIEWLSNTKDHFSQLSQTEVDGILKLFDGMNGANSKNGETSAKEILNWLTDVDKGLGLTEEMAQAYGFDSLQQMAERIRDDYYDYQEGIEKLYKSVPVNLKDKFKEFAESNDFNLTELTGIKDALVHAVAVGGAEAGDALLEVFKGKGIENAAALANEINQIDWSQTSIDQFVDKMIEMGYITPDAATGLGLVLEKIEEIAKIDIGQAVEQYNATEKAVNAVKSGTGLTSEDYGKLEPELQSYFQMVADGTYKVKGDAEEFYKVANESSIQGFKDNLDELEKEENSIKNLKERGSDYFINGSFYNSDANTYDKNGFKDSMAVLEAAGVESDKLDKWWSDYKDDKKLNSSTIKEVTAALKEQGEEGWTALTERMQANSEEQEQNKNALISSAKTYEDFLNLIKGKYAKDSDKDLWEQIGFDPASVKNAEDLLQQIEDGTLTTSTNIKAAWDNVKGSTDSLSKDGFETLLNSFDSVEDKTNFVKEAVSKVTWSFEDLQRLSELKEQGLLSEDTWNNITSKMDTSGLTLSELDEKYKQFLSPETYEKWKKAAQEATLSQIDNIEDLNKELASGNIDADNYQKKFKELLESGDVTAEDAINSLNTAIKTGNIDAEDAEEWLDKILDNTCTNTEERLEALKKILELFPELAKYSKDSIDTILGDDTTSINQKISDIMSSDASDIDKANGLQSLASLDNISPEQLQQISSCLLEIGNNANFSDSELQTFGEICGEVFSKSKISAEEAIPALFSIFGVQEGGEELQPEIYQALGNAIETILTALGDNATNAFGIISQACQTAGIDISQLGIELESAFNIDENLTVVENLEKLNAELEKTHNIDDYAKALKELLSGELDWTMRTEEAAKALIAFEVSLARAKGKLEEQATTLGNAITTFEEYQILMTEIGDDTKDAAARQKAQTSALLALGKQYDSCKNAVAKYEAALRSGKKEAQDMAKRELEISARSAEAASKWNLEAKAVEELANEYAKLNTYTDEEGNIHEMNAEVATDLASRYLTLNNGIANLQSNWEDYAEVLNSLNMAGAADDAEAMNSILADQGETLENLRSAMAEVMNVTNSAAISNEFLAENAGLVEEAMNGDSEAIAQLQVKFAEGVEAEIRVNDEPFHATLNGDEVYLSEWVQNLPEGELGLDDSWYLQKLINAMYEAGMAQEDIEDKLSGMGIDVDLEPYYGDLESAMQGAEEAGVSIEESFAKHAEKAVEEGSISGESVTSDQETTDEHHYVSTNVSTNPIPYTVTVPEYHMTSTDTGFAIEGGPKEIPLTYDEIKVEPQDAPAEQKTVQRATGLQLKTAHKTAGGQVSHKNLSGGNKRSNSGSNGSRPRRESAPRTRNVNVPHISAPDTKTHDTKRHDQKYNERERLEDYKKDPIMRELPSLKTDKEEVYTTRKKYYNQRYDKDRKVDEKEYETKESSMFKRTSDEIERYHDVNNALDKISQKLEEIDQRKSRAFGKAHINALNEEKAALEEQLATQNKYIGEMADRRKELQKEMGAQGWKFDEEGSISNYVEKTTQDVLDYNRGMEQWNEQANKNRKMWNDEAHDITDVFNESNRAATDYLNASMTELTDDTNELYETLDKNINSAYDSATSGYNATVQTAADKKFNQEIAANTAYEAAMGVAINAKNSGLTSAENTWESGVTAAEEAWETSISGAEYQRIKSYDEAASDYYSQTGGISETTDYLEERAETLQNQVDTAKENYDDAVDLAEDTYSTTKANADNLYSNTIDDLDNAYDIAIKVAERNFDMAKTDAEAKLKQGNAQSTYEYNQALQNAQRAYDIAVQEAKQEYDKKKREIDNDYDDKEHEINNNYQDKKDLAQDMYDSSMEELDKEYEAAEALNDIAREQVEFSYEESQKLRGEYEDLEDTMAQAMLDAQELRNKLYDNALEVIDYTLNLKVQLSNEVMSALTALLDSLGDSADKASDRIATLGQQMYQYTYQTQAHKEAIADLINSQKELDSNIMNRFMNGNFTQDDLNKLFNTDEFTADKITKLETYRDGLIDLISQQRALKEQMFETVTGAFSEYQTSLGRQIEKITSLTKVTQTYQSIVNIVGKKVLDASGELSETLAKAAFDTQRDQTHTYKSILDEIDSNIADMKQKQAAYDENSEMFKDFQKRIDDMEAERRSAQDNWLSSWEAEMQAATDYYANAIDTIAMHFEQSISGLIGSLDLLSKEYDRQREIQDVYVDDYEKIYQLSKLTRDIEAAIDDSDHVKNKQRLKKLQEEINAASADGVKMSQYDLDVLRKKFELELARDELEEARNAKSQVRMMRDAEGNYGYVYTADANAVADAEQSYEDKLHELQVLNSEYIEQLEDNYLQLQQNVRDEIASLDITQFATEEEYLAEVDRIQQHAIEMQERISQQMGNALGNNRDLYENEWTEYSKMTGYKISADEDYIDKFNETTYSVLTGFSAMNEAKQQFTSSLAEAIAGAIEAYRATAEMQQVAMEDGGTSMEDFSKDAIQSTEAVVQETQKLATEAETLSETYQDAFGQIADSAADFADNYVKNIQPVIDSNLKLLDTIAKIIEHQANLGGGSGDGSGSGGMASGVKSSGSTWDAFASAGDTIGATSKIGNYLPYVAALLMYGGYESNYGGWGTSTERRQRLVDVFGAGADEDVNKYLAEHAAADLGSYWLAIANNPEAYSYDKLKNMKFDTGGYTGNWNSLDGKLALLHEKELVLNQQDTDNILSAVDMVRRITQMIDLNALSAGSFMSDILSAATISTANSETLQQEVHITAEFPNATDRNEIIEAFDNLTNLALQYAGKQNYV